MKKKRLIVSRIFALLMLSVFALALTPWSALHHHDAEEQRYCSKGDKVCMHKSHIGNETHYCLICSAHFVKDFHHQPVSFQVVLPSQRLLRNYALISGNYTALIRQSLRGPPVV